MRYGQDTQNAQIWQRFACDMTFLAVFEHGYRQEDFIDPDSESEDETVELEEHKLVIF